MHADLAGDNVDPAELAKFERLAAEWWDPDGKFKPLHKFNPVRLGYVRDKVAAHFGRGCEGPKTARYAGKSVIGYRIAPIAVARRGASALAPAAGQISPPGQFSSSRKA